MSDANKATLRRFLDEAFGKGNLAASSPLLASLVLEPELQLRTEDPLPGLLE